MQEQFFSYGEFLLRNGQFVRQFRIKEATLDQQQGQHYENFMASPQKQQRGDHWPGKILRRAHGYVYVDGLRFEALGGRWKAKTPELSIRVSVGDRDINLRAYLGAQMRTLSQRAQRSRERNLASAKTLQPTDDLAKLHAGLKAETVAERRASIEQTYQTGQSPA